MTSIGPSSAQDSTGDAPLNRLDRLRHDIARLPVDEEFRAALLASVERYADQILARPPDGTHDGMDDLEAVSQVTLSDLYEASAMRLAGGD
ncbi:MAG: hypothetical protein KDG55_00585 [Rhodocyclaceae bacterium]|nr:hypothetical protein [Rhodocyclaceae bacterium]